MAHCGYRSIAGALLVLHVTLSGCLASSACPAGWISYISTEGGCIAVFTSPVGWFSALNACHDYGGSLISIENAFQNTQVFALAAETDASCNLWIGLSNLEGADCTDYSWVDRTPFKFTRWYPGYPPCAEENVAFMVVAGGNNQWKTASVVDNFKKCYACMTADASLSTAITGKTSLASTDASSTVNSVLSWRDCNDLLHLHQKKQSGVYVLEDGTTAYCDMETLGGGWTTLMRRVDNLYDFHTANYTSFFGDPSGSHWQSLDWMANMTSDSKSTLLVEAKGIRNSDGTTDDFYAYDLYETHFSITEAPQYEIYFFYPRSSGNLTGLNDFYKQSDQSDFQVFNTDGYSHGGWWLNTKKHSPTDVVAFYLNGDYNLLGTQGMYVCHSSSTDASTCTVLNPKEVSMKVRRKV